MAEGDIDKAEELSDRLAAREVSGLLTKALRKHIVLCRKCHNQNSTEDGFWGIFPVS